MQIKVEKTGALTYMVNQKAVKAYGHVVQSDEDLSLQENAALMLFLAASKRVRIQSSVYSL